MHAVRYFTRFLFLSLSGVIWLVPQYCYSASDPRHMTSRHARQVRKLASYSNPLAWAAKMESNHGTTSSTSNNYGPDQPTIFAAEIAADNSKLSPEANGFKYAVEVYIRAFYLFFLFLPVLLLAPFAFFSPAFRVKFWFPLLKMTIANSGAVSSSSYFLLHVSIANFKFICRLL